MKFKLLFFPLGAFAKLTNVDLVKYGPGKKNITIVAITAHP
jgi:hypothetical protein